MNAAVWRKWADWMLGGKAFAGCSVNDREGLRGTTHFGDVWGVDLGAFDGTGAERALLAYFIAEFVEAEGEQA